MAQVKLRVLTPLQHEFLQDKDPRGFYDRSTLEKLSAVLQKLENFRRDCTRTEARLAKQFRDADPGLLLPEASVTQGRLASDSPICIEGRHDGDVATQGLLIVTETGQVDGNVSARSVFCKGRITGEVQAREKVKVYATGMLVGPVYAPSLQIESGAIVKGYCLLGPVPQPAREPAELPKKSFAALLFGAGFLGLR